MTDATPASIPSTASLELRIAGWASRRGLWIGVIALILAMQFKWWWVPTPDSAGYCSNARSIAAGKMERLGSTKLIQPPGYPLLIAPSFWFGDKPWVALTINNTLLLAALAAAIWVWLSPLAGPATPMLTALAMANVSLWRYSRMNLSEPAAMLWMLTCALAMRRLLQSSAPGPRLAWALACGVLATIAGLTRIVGGTIVAGMGLALLLAGWRGLWPWRRSLGLGVLIGALGVIGPVGFLLYDHAQTDPGNLDYLHYLTDQNPDLAANLIEGVRLRLSEVGGLLLPGMFKARSQPGQWWHVNIAIYLGVMAVVLLGMIRVLRRGCEPVILAFPFFFAVCCVYAYPSVTRYMLPMLPVLVLAMWSALAGLRGHRHSIVLLLLLGHLGVAIGQRIGTLDDELALHRRWPGVERVITPLRDDPRPIGCLGITTEERLFFSWPIDRNIVKHTDPAAIDPSIHWLLVPAAEPLPSGFEPRDGDGQVRLLERR
jgi:hypothetical protein